jgi:polysaccharide biosynthesis transport protein
VRRLLRTNITKLELLRNVETGDAQIADRADVPTRPSSPKTLRNIVIGACLGLLIGLALALLAEMADTRLRKPEDLEQALGLSLLTSVPRSKALRRTQLNGAIGAGELEAFRRLRANLRYRGDDHEVRSLLVTSAGSGSGKTTVAVYLAASAAATQRRVLLIEADLRRPRVAELLGIPPGHDLRRALEPGAVNGDLGFYEVGIDPASGEDASASASFEVLPAGTPRPDASELLDSEEMRRLVSAATKAFDLVIIDGPPPSLISDAIPLMKQVTGVVVVARMGRESREDVEQLRVNLDLLDIRTLGAVATFSRRTSNVYLPSS